jgi:curved DNA-binding protein CbpA
MEHKFTREYKYYRILGLNKEASGNDIKRAYRSVIKKYHPDFNKDPKAAEIAKKINEAYRVLSNPKEKLIYDNSEAECPKCWTHEVRRSQGRSWSALHWECRHCGCSFTFVTKEKEEDSEEAYTEYEKVICPRCGKVLVLDDFLKLYRCKNKKCKSVFSRYELKKYYSSSFKVRRGKGTANKRREKIESKEVVLSANARLALKFVFGVSLLLTAIMLYFLLFSFSLLAFGLFLFLFGFSALSWYIYRYPNIISTIKSLILKK